jgi:hypothetical protein
MKKQTLGRTLEVSAIGLDFAPAHLPRTFCAPNGQTCALTLDQSHHLDETTDGEAP